MSAFADRASLDDVAERLDLATDGQNRIATARELARQPTATQFENVAIADGLEQLLRVWQTAPVLPVQPLRYRRTGVLLGVAGLLVWAAFLIPLFGRVAADSIGGGGMNTAAGISAPPGPVPHRVVAAAVERIAPPVLDAAPASATQSGGNQLQSKTEADHTSSFAADGSMDTARASAGAIGTPQADAGKDGRPGTQSTPVGQGRVDQSESLGRTEAAAPAGASAAGPAPGVKSAGGSAAKPSSPTPSGDAEPSDGQKGGSADGASGPPPEDKSDPGDGDGVGANGESDIAIPPGGGTSMAPSSVSGSAGEGRTSGKSPPKKARGVAPLMLGAKQPDLLEGRPLAGPDERTKVQVPPKREPGGSAAAAGARARQGDERPVGQFQVPPELLGVVGQYFQQFHQDATTPAALPAAR